MRTDSGEDASLETLRCPRDGTRLVATSEGLRCEAGHVYPLVQGAPVFLLEERAPTFPPAAASLAAARSLRGAPLFIETLGLSEEEKRGVARDWRADAAVDAAISWLVAATCGRGYRGCAGRLTRYPIPVLPLPPGEGRLLLDIGCSWGRWSVAAARAGWRVVGVDPSLGAVLAARRAFGATPGLTFVCADARALPFAAGGFDAVFSYSVLQHFSREDAGEALAEIGRVLRVGGTAKIQMANAAGLRSPRAAQSADAAAEPFRVRYWPLEAMRAAAEAAIGPTTLAPEAYGGLGLLPEDWRVVDGRTRLAIAASLALRGLARLAPALGRRADSVYVASVRAAPGSSPVAVHAAD